jgi:hypothetical protein
VTQLNLKFPIVTVKFVYYYGATQVYDGNKLK